MGMFAPLNPSAGGSSFKPVYDDKELKITPLCFPWTMANDMFFTDLIPDSFFKQIIVDQTSSSNYFDVVAERNSKDFLPLTTVLADSIGVLPATAVHKSGDYAHVFSEYHYPGFSAHNIHTDLQADLNLAASVIKSIAWDSLYAICAGLFPEKEISFKEYKDKDGKIVQAADPQKQAAQKIYLKLFKRIRLNNLSNIRRSIAYMIEKDDNNGQIVDEETGEYTIASKSPCFDIISVMVRHLARQFTQTYCLGSKSMLVGRGTIKGYGDFEETLVGVTESVLNVEFRGASRGLMDSYGIPTSDDNDDPDSDGVAPVLDNVQEKVKEIISIAGGGINFNDGYKFADKIINLCVGSKFTSSGLFTDKVSGGAKTEDNESSSKMHRMGKLDRSIFASGLRGQRYVENKARNKALTVKKTEHEEIATGGDVYLLADTTGSTTWAHNGPVALMYVIESLCQSIAETARNGERNSNFFFYDMGINSITRIPHDASEEEYALGKWSLLNRARGGGNDEIQAFVQLRREISFMRDTGIGHEENPVPVEDRQEELDAVDPLVVEQESDDEKITVIFITDGGMLTNASQGLVNVGDKVARNRVSESRKLNLMLKDMRSQNVEFLPILFSASVDEVCAEVFNGFPVAHITSTADFGKDEIDELLVAIDPKLAGGEADEDISSDYNK